LIVIAITPQISIDETQIDQEFVRASGPGGQNVNKVSTAVVLRFSIDRSQLPEAVRRRLVRLAGNRVTEGGVLIVKAQQYRTQERNRAAALERIVELIKEAAQPPTPRVATRPTRASQVRKLESKRRRGAIKKLRGRVQPGTD
jgi:ribosome-associated protein